jgi:hypothetical protein
MEEMEMSKKLYVALEEFEWDGETVMVDQEVELTDEQAAALLEEGKIKLAEATEDEEEEEDEDEDEDGGNTDEDEGEDEDFGDETE